MNRFGRENGYFLIVEKRIHSVVYVAPAADLTDEIIRLYDQQISQKSCSTPEKPGRLRYGDMGMAYWLEKAEAEIRELT